MHATAGLHWAKETEDVCIAKEHGRVLGKPTFSHDEAGIGELVEWQVERATMERLDGRLGGWLLTA